MYKKPVIVFEGIEGSGKTLHINYISKYLKRKKINFIKIREPGGCKNSEKLRKLILNKKTTFKNMRVSGAFHGWLPLNKQKKIPKVLKLMQFPCSDALSYAHLCEGKLDVVIQCQNKIWDIHALIPIINAAGGVASTWNEKSAEFAGNILVSSNRSIHNKMLKLLKPALK